MAGLPGQPGHVPLSVDASFVSGVCSFMNRIRINGKKYSLRENFSLREPLSWFLREEAGLKGTKVGCGSGRCGACTVNLNGQAVNSCLTPLGFCLDKDIVTIEGIEASNPEMTKLFQKMHASQCGFCSPGFLNKIFSEVCSKGECSESSLQNNLCRCTGYRPILDFAKCLTLNDVETKMSEDDDLSGKLVVSNSLSKAKANALKVKKIVYDESPEVRSVELVREKDSYYEPCTLDEAKELRKAHAELKVSYSPLMDFSNKEGRRRMEPVQLLVMNRIESLKFIKRKGKDITVGASTPISELIEFCRKKSVHGYLADFLSNFGTNNLKEFTGIGALFNRNTNMSPLLRSVIARTEVEDGFITSVTFHEPKHRLAMLFFGESHIKTLSLVVGYKIEKSVVKIERFEGCIGCQNQYHLTEFFVENFKFKEFENVDQALECINYNYLLAPDKQSLIYYQSLIRQTMERIFSGKEKSHFMISGMTAAKQISGTQEYQRHEAGNLFLPGQHQNTSEAPRSPVGEPLPHASAKKHASGTAVFADDIVPPQNVLYAAHVKSPVARGQFVMCDPSRALQMSGVVGYFDSRDLAPFNRKRYKEINDDTEKVFATGFVRCVGEPIGLIVAESHEQALKAAKMVDVQIDRLDDTCIHLEEGILMENFFPYDHGITKGELRDDDTDVTYGDKVKIGGQHHWYLEPHALMVVPEDNDEITVYSCTQCVMKTQNAIAGVLGINQNNVNVIVKRIGGGFGGKETLSTFTAARLAVAAQKLQRPVKILMEREEDTLMNGGRHAFIGEFR